MPTRRPINKSAYRTVNDHIRDLPILKQMSTSQQVLIKAASSWQNWRNRNLSPVAAAQASLSHFDDGVLVINCSTSAIATQIRNLQGRLLKHFHQDGLHAITKITVRLRQINDSCASVKDPLYSISPESQGNAAAHRSSVTSRNSLESIRQCRKSITNEQLSKALTRLEKTLSGR